MENKKQNKNNKQAENHSCPLAHIMDIYPSEFYRSRYRKKETTFEIWPKNRGKNVSKRIEVKFLFNLTFYSTD